MKKYLIEFEWKIEDTRDKFSGFGTGVSSLIVEEKSKEEAFNRAIDVAQHIPSWEFNRNGIDIKEYRESNTCTYHYSTQITKVLRIKEVR